MLALMTLSLILDASIDIPWIYIYVAVAYFSRAACGPVLDPISWLTFYLIRPAVDFVTHAKPSYTAGPPKRFPSLIPSIVSISSDLLSFGVAFLLYPIV